MTGTTPSRRQVVRAGAWTVPAIAVAAAAPAFAASGANIKNPGSTATITQSGSGGNREFSVTTTIRNDGPVATENLTVRITITGGANPSVTQTPIGFTLFATENVTGGVTFVFTANAQLAGNGATIPVPPTAAPVFKVKPGNNSGTISVVYTATNSPSSDTFTTIT